LFMSRNKLKEISLISKIDITHTMRRVTPLGHYVFQKKICATRKKNRRCTSKAIHGGGI
jgi:hypothetical protein